MKEAIIKDDVFKEAVELVLKLEGNEYTETNGHSTKYGIAKHTFPHLDIRNLTRDEAINIYYFYFWLPHCETIARASPLLASIFFTVIVNMGLHTASMCLQDAINRLKPDNKIQVDGIIGPITMSKVQLHKENLIIPLLIESVKRYFYIANANIQNRKFLHGWLHRVIKVLNWFWRQENGNND